ncbi:MAG: tRNA 4-thiouridine(8) synthase ThiI [Gammaproteobacteria bacterium]|nr:tRNA 4-thiouridine(8) synthase ThiI [Gammaproteobacteria bacterium]
MLYLIKLFPEITIKSRPVRRRFIRQLRKNLREVLKELDDSISVIGEWDVLEIQTSCENPAMLAAINDRIASTPGIANILQADKHPLPSIEEIFHLTRDVYEEKITGKTFAVRCKRTGKHPFKSIDIEQYVGGGLKQNCNTAGVKLKNPDVSVFLEIRDDFLYIIKRQISGLGGFPLGCQDAVLSLVSGGFDSTVSSFLCIKRGLQTHYCFFNLGGKAHELAVKEVALFLWIKYHSSHRVKFVSVPFEGIVEEILNKIDDSQMGVILKRMMLRAAEAIAKRMNINGLVTGESIAQVSSQTLMNLAVIDSVTETMVLRPLCTSDKQEIIDIAREIGAEDFSKNIPEYCAVISKNPTTKAKLEKIENEENRFDFEKLQAAIDSARYQLITEVVDDFNNSSSEVAIEKEVSNGSIVIDIRHPDDLEITPLQIAGAEILNIPFYQLRTNFSNLNKDAHYLLYCDKGMMSRLHAAHLQDEGFSNIGVLDLRSSS